MEESGLCLKEHAVSTHPEKDYWLWEWLKVEKVLCEMFQIEEWKLSLLRSQFSTSGILPLLFENWYCKPIIIEVVSWNWWNQINNLICLGFSSGEKKKTTPIFVCDHCLEDKWLCSLLQASVHSLRHYITFFFFVIDFFIRNFQNNFKTKYFPSALLFLTCSLADLAVSIVHWQINHCQGSVPQCTRVMSPKLTLQSCRGPYFIALSKLADFAASHSEGKHVIWKTASSAPRKNLETKVSYKYNI